MTNTIEAAKALTFGTELEYTNISRERAARAIHTVVGGTVRYTGGSYDEWTVIAPDGRHWKAISDGSLTDRATSAEVVTPLLKWDDLETLQAVVRALRHAGAKTPDCTSQHVHVGIADFDARQIANIARIFYKQEELILKAAGTLERRLQHYTRRTDRAFIERLEKAKPTTRDALNRAWFGYANPPPRTTTGPLPRHQPQQCVADGHGRIPAFQRHDPRWRGQGPHSALPRDCGESQDRGLRLHQKPAPLQPGKRQVRPPGFPPPPRPHRSGIQEHPDAPHEADARFLRLEERQTGRPVKQNGGAGKPALRNQHGLRQ